MAVTNEGQSLDSFEGFEKHAYHQEDGEEDSLLSSVGRCGLVEKTKTSWFSTKLHIVLITLNTLFLIAGILAWFTVVVSNRPQPSSATSDQNAFMCSADSRGFPPTPAREAVQFELRRFTGIGAHESEFVGPANDEIDRKWDHLIDNGKWFAIDREMFVKINGNPDTGLRIPNDPGGRFFGMLQVNHQLHCVDVMRRSTWYNIKRYRNKDQFQNMSDVEVIRHTNHCLEILRQSLQCHGDIAMLTYNWVHGHDWPQSAWRSLHSCQSWDALNEWRAENDISHLVTHLERPAWVLDPNSEAPGHGYRGAAEAVDPIVCRDLQCEP